MRRRFARSRTNFFALEAPLTDAFGQVAPTVARIPRKALASVSAARPNASKNGQSTDKIMTVVLRRFILP